MAIIDANIAREIAEQNPELHQVRQTAFGTDYLKDIEQDTGTAQYYGGWGNIPGYGFMPGTGETLIEETPTVDAPNQIGTGTPILETSVENQGTVPMVVQPTTDTTTAPYVETSPNILSAVDDTGQPISGNIVDPATGDIYAPGDYTDVAGTLADPREKIDTFPETIQTPIVQDPMTGDASIAEQIAAQDRQRQEELANLALTGPGSEIEKTDVKPAGGIVDAGLATLGAIAGYPIGLITNAIGAIPESQSQIEYEGYNPTQQQAIDTAYGPGGVMEGYNVVSGFGEGVKATVEDRLDTINRTLETKDSEILEARKTELENLLQTIDPQPETYTTGETMVVTQDPIEKTYEEKADDVWQDIEVIRTPAGEVLVNTQTGEVSNNIEDLIEKDTTPVQEATGVVQDTTTGDASIAEQIAAQDRAESAPAYEDFSEPNVQASSGDVYAGSAYGYDEAAEKSDNGGGGGGGGKIVCTMMNDSYGFGDFRNKIWLRQSKNLAPEYQKGYHILFLPLVKLSKKNKLLKKTLEHIAVHRTIDIRQEARGKRHLLGRIYRKILEPICYWVGKYAKR